MTTKDQSNKARRLGAKNSLHEETRIIYERVPDRLEIIIRAICGAAASLFLTFGIWRVWRNWDFIYVVLLGAGFAILFAWLAVKKGDSFWF